MASHSFSKPLMSANRGPGTGGGRWWDRWWPHVGMFSAGSREIQSVSDHPRPQLFCCCLFHPRSLPGLTMQPALLSVLASSLVSGVMWLHGHHDQSAPPGPCHTGYWSLVHSLQPPPLSFCLIGLHSGQDKAHTPACSHISLRRLRLSATAPHTHPSLELMHCLSSPRHTLLSHFRNSPVLLLLKDTLPHPSS